MDVLNYDKRWVTDRKDEKDEKMKNDEYTKNQHVLMKIFKNITRWKEDEKVKNRTKIGQNKDEKMMIGWKDDTWLKKTIISGASSTVTTMIGLWREWMEFWPCFPNSIIYHL